MRKLDEAGGSYVVEGDDVMVYVGLLAKTDRNVDAKDRHRQIRLVALSFLDENWSTWDIEPELTGHLQARLEDDKLYLRAADLFEIEGVWAQ